MNNLSSSRFHGSLMGDPTLDELASASLVGDYSPVELTEGDVETADRISNGPNVVASVAAPSQMTATRKEVLAMPGRALESSKIPALWGTNITITQPGALAKIPGSLLIQNLAKHRTATPLATQIKTSVGAGISNTTTVTFASSDLPSGAGLFTCPIVFVSVSASTLNAAAGAGLSVWIETQNEFSILNTRDVWSFERKNIQAAMRLTLIPYVRLKDDLIPVLASWGAGSQTLSIKIKGLDTTESVRVTIPGVDSQELRAFLKTWKVF